MIATIANRIGAARGMLGTRAARVLVAGSRPRIASNASQAPSQTAAAGTPPASVWSGPQRTTTLGPPILRRAQLP